MATAVFRKGLGVVLAGALPFLVSLPARAGDALPPPILDEPVSDPLSAMRPLPPSPASRWDTVPGASPCRFEPRALDDLAQPLALVDLVDRALCFNPRTRQTWATAKAQAADVGAKRGAYLPTLDFSGGVDRVKTRYYGLPEGVSGIPTIPDIPNLPGTQVAGTSTQYNAALSFDYLLFDFGGRDATLEAARESLAAANWSHDRGLQEIMFSVIEAYYTLFANRESAAAFAESERSSEESFKAAQARFNAGGATRADVLVAQTNLSQARLNRQNAENAALGSRGQLAQLIGIDANMALAVAPPRAAVPDEQAERDVARLVEEARRRRPDLAAEEARVRASAANVRAQIAAGKPRISLGASSSYNDANKGFGSRTDAIGISVSVPLFTGFTNTYQILQAEGQLEAQLATRDSLRNQVAFDVWDAYQAGRTARDAFANGEAVLASAIESESVALGRYKAGVGTFTDLASAQAALASARQQRIQAVYDWLIAKARLGQALGVLELSDRTAASIDGAGPPRGK